MKIKIKHRNVIENNVVAMLHLDTLSTLSSVLFTLEIPSSTYISHETYFRWRNRAIGEIIKSSNCCTTSNEDEAGERNITQNNEKIAQMWGQRVEHKLHKLEHD